MVKLRTTADEDEATNLAGQPDTYCGASPNRRVGLVLDPSKMTKEAKQKASQQMALNTVFFNNPSFFKKYGGQTNWLNNYK
jgi:hypothetical protein